MKYNKLHGTTFFGHEASDHAKEKGYLDYGTLAKAFDCICNNGILDSTLNCGYWMQEHGAIDNSEAINDLKDQIEELTDEMKNLDSDDYDNDDDFDAAYDKIEEQISELEDQIEDLENEQNAEPEIFQYYIISDEGADILKNWTDEIVFYNEYLDMYVWGVTHCGTSWDYVLTGIKLNCGDEAFQ